MTSHQLALAIALGYGFSLWMTYKIIKSAVKDALIELSAVNDAFRELKAAEKAKAEKEAQEMTTAKIQD